MQEASAVSVATQKKRELDSSFFKKGIMVALFSSLMYGFYTAFVTAGQNSQLWTSWTSATSRPWIPPPERPCSSATASPSAIWWMITA